MLLVQSAGGLACRSRFIHLLGNHTTAAINRLYRPALRGACAAAQCRGTEMTRTSGSGLCRAIRTSSRGRSRRTERVASFTRDNAFSLSAQLGNRQHQLAWLRGSKREPDDRRLHRRRCGGAGRRELPRFCAEPARVSLSPLPIQAPAVWHDPGPNAPAV